jgi:hypothetical protein
LKKPRVKVHPIHNECRFSHLLPFEVTDKLTSLLNPRSLL